MSPLDAPIPGFYNLEISSQCNLKCPHCPTGRGDIPVEDRGYITDEHFNEIFNKIKPYARVVQLFNWGEPFMHKNLLSFVRTFSGAGIKTHISSNLSVKQFSEAELEEIVRSGLTSIVASIDGTAQKQYEAYRVNGSFSKAFGNLVSLKQMKEKLGSETPHLIWAFHLNRYNQCQVARAKEIAEELGLTLWFKELSCPEDFQASAVKWWPKLLAQPTDLPDLWEGRGNGLISVADLDPRLPKTCNVCLMPFEILVIFINGDVYPCTACIGKDLAVGNLLREPLDEIWNKKMRRNREQLLNVDRIVEGSQCRKCKHFPS